MSGQWPLDRFPAKQGYTPRTSGAGFTNHVHGPQASATPHTKGGFDYTDFIGKGANGILIHPFGGAVDNTDTSSLMDIIVEAPGQGDRVIVADMQVGWMRGRQKPIFIPMSLPPSSYFGFRVQSVIPNKSIPLVFDTFVGEGGSSLSVPQKFTTYGTNLATSAAVPVTPAQGTKGAWTEITAATTAPLHELIVTVQGTGTLVNDGDAALDIAIGAAGSETVIFKNFNYSGNNAAEDYNYEYPFYLPVRFNIPTGVRLSVRIAVNDAAVQPVSVQLIGITY